MRVYCWEEGWYDFDLKTGTTSRKLTAASMVPLFVGMCTPEEATITAENALSSLLAEGGLLTTNTESGQQWDAPNGWAPLQWIAIEGDQSPPPAFRMSPQTVRITVVGSSETEEAAGGLATTDVLAVEDRPPVASPVGNRQRFTLTEVFSPKNARWRDPTVL
mgnify:CR=1 FL=1